MNDQFYTNENIKHEWLTYKLYFVTCFLFKLPLTCYLQFNEGNINFSVDFWLREVLSSVYLELYASILYYERRRNVLKYLRNFIY